MNKKNQVISTKTYQYIKRINGTGHLLCYARYESEITELTNAARCPDFDWSFFNKVKEIYALREEKVKENSNTYI